MFEMSLWRQVRKYSDIAKIIMKIHVNLERALKEAVVQGNTPPDVYLA